MVTPNDAPVEPNGNVDSLISDALGGVPQADAPIPSTETQAPVTPPELGVPAPDAVAEGSAPPAEVPTPPLTSDAIALAEAQARIDTLQQTNQQFHQERDALQVQQRQDQIVKATEGIAQQLVNGGLDTTIANQYAQALAQSQQQGQEAAREEAGRVAAARHYGTQYGISPDIIANLPSPEAMELAAKQEARNNHLEKQITELRQGQLPTQAFDSSVGLSTSITMAQKQAAAGRGEYTWTPAELVERTTAALNKIPGH